MMHEFYVSMECDCGEDIFQLVATSESRNGRPVVPFDIASQERWDCDRCGRVHYTGDFQDAIETEEPPEANEDDEDGE